jgi:uncharacterized repeat protein (TIGR03803 family)
MMGVLPARAQTFTVLHNFSGGGDGNFPTSGLIADRAGNLYGTALEGGARNGGTVFKMTRQASGWTLLPLYTFQGGNDGNGPHAGVIFGPNGSLYGATSTGGGSNCGLGSGCGTVFNLRPSPTFPVTVLAPWRETQLYRFRGTTDGANPMYGELIFDAAGNLYGTTEGGGAAGFGAVFKLTPNGGGWTQSIIYSFSGAQDGKSPQSGVMFDNAGNLYGTTESGGASNFGTVYQLTPSGSGWTENTLHNFSGGNDGAHPWGALLFDGTNNFYGTSTGGEGGDGTIFKLTLLNGSWEYAVLHNFSGNDGQGPVDSMIMGADGSLYGTALDGGANGYGSVFKLTPGNGGWTYASLHDFNNSDGNSPFGNLVFDSSGNLYGTAFSGGADGLGVVFEIMP